MLIRRPGYLLNVLWGFNLHHVSKGIGGSLFSQTLYKNSKFFVMYSLVNVDNSSKTANLYTFTKETFNGKLHFFVTLKNYGLENYANLKIMKHVENMSKLKLKSLKVKLRLFLSYGLFGGEGGWG